MLQDTTEILSAIVARVRSADPVNSRSWFDELAVLDFSGGLLEIGCPDAVKAQFLQDHCQATFTQSALSVTGHLVTVHFAVAGKPSAPRKVAEPPFKLHPDYTFDNFVVGPCNRLAHASCVAVSHALGSTYNPLFLYGSVGLGKTHLLHAICHEVLRGNQAAAIQFLSCESFMNRFISAIEQGTVAEFQRQLRTVDLLIIDDIQFLREREQSQEEFFHTFNALYNNHKQIILTADSSPSDLSVEDRLISRFKWGLVARLDPPGYETRVAIVQKKAGLRGLAISDEIAQFVARQVQTNIRELEGALTILYATANTTGQPLTLAVAQQALGHAQPETQRHITITHIIAAVTGYYNLRAADLQSKRRSQSIALPRQICMYLARNLTRHSLEEIGGHLGGRDHSTVLHACEKITQLIESDPAIRSQLAELTDRIQQAS
ncbi:MAG: chromosomal replication initiator protein DnaA [Phycisphaerae bacterium]|nr:chromosomal replication initiator protein DnaA [Phycisphaerae bacterium]